MTKAKAKKLMVEYDRSIIETSLAQKISKAFGFSLSDLNIQPQKTKDILGEYCPEETKELSGVSMFEVAQQIAYKVSGKLPITNKFGRGSGAEDIVRQAVELLN